MGQRHWWRAPQGAQGRTVKQDGAAAPCMSLCGMGCVCGVSIACVCGCCVLYVWGVRGVLCVKECGGLGDLGLGTASGTQWVRARDVGMSHLTKTWTVLNTCSPSFEKHCTNCDPTNNYKHECLPLTLCQEHFPEPLTLLSLVNTCSCLCLRFSSFSLVEQQLPRLLSSPTDRPCGQSRAGWGHSEAQRDGTCPRRIRPP